MHSQRSSIATTTSTLRVKRLSYLIASAMLASSPVAWGQVVLHADGTTVVTKDVVATGASSVEKTGTGTYVITGANQYTGGTTISGGTLRVSGFGSIIGNVVNNGTLAVDRTGWRFDGSITGSGKLVVSSSLLAGVTLTGDHTYTGGTTINSGKLTLGNGTKVGSLQGDIVNNGTFGVYNNAGNVVLNNSISGSGGFQKSGAGTLTLTSNNTYTGDTLLGGVLEIGALGGRSGALTSNITSDGGSGTVTFNRNDDTTFSNTIRVGQSGTLNINKNGEGTLTFDKLVGIDRSTLTINGGSVVVDGGLLAGYLRGNGNLRINASTNNSSRISDRIYSGMSVTVADSAVLALGGANGGEFAGNIVNNGSLRSTGGTSKLSAAISGSGGLETTASVLTVSGNNTYTGGTVLGFGTLELGSTGALGTSGSITFKGGGLKFSAANTTDYSARFTGMATKTIDTNGQAVTFATGLSGSGLTKQGNGTLTLTGQNTYLGATTVSAGVFAIGNGGTTGSLASGSISVAGPATLAFNRADTSSYSGALTGTGTLVKQGDGTLVFNNTATFSGKTEILDGELRSTGSIGSAVRIAAGAALTGSGRVGALDVEGLLNAAAGIGSLTANSAIFDAGSIFRWELADAAGAAGVGYDMFTTTGATTFGGDANNKIKIQLGLVNADGTISNFDTGIDHRFVLMTADSGFKGLDLAAFDLDASGLRLDGRRGSWSLSNSGNVLSLNYIASLVVPDEVPEPATVLVFLTGLAGIGMARRRKAA